MEAHGTKEAVMNTALERLGGLDREYCIPTSMLDGPVPNYEQFLLERRVLMAAKLRTYFEKLGKLDQPN